MHRSRLGCHFFLNMSLVQANCKVESPNREFIKSITPVGPAIFNIFAVQRTAHTTRIAYMGDECALQPHLFFQRRLVRELQGPSIPLCDEH